VIKTARLASILIVAVLSLAGMALAQTDPGVQSGSRGTGAAFTSVLSNSPSGILSFFTDGQNRFQAVESVSNSPTGNNGLGPYNAPNGGVEDLFTVSGRSDAGTCSLPQPSFSTAQATNNIIFRIPTPVFGAGLIENLDDSTLLNNQVSNNNNNLGISGAFNRNGNDGTITRFGWVRPRCR
jgi:hypothetical protein